MVSTTRWASSPGSSCSSNGGSWDLRQDLMIGGRDQTFVGPLSADDEREVARRVLEDLETLYHDSEDESEENDDDFDSDSEWESETSLFDRYGKRSGGGMTLDELSVAVNAAIEYHRPTKLVVVEPPVRHPRSDAGEDSVDRSRERHQQPHFRHRQKKKSKESNQREEPVLAMFQEMLEKKERHFYSLQTKTTAIGFGSKEEERVERRNFTVNQQQHTTACVRDQATETENHPSYSAFDTSVAEFNSPPHSPPQSTYNRFEPTSKARIEPVAVGPTLADLANSCRRSRRSHSTRSFSASESSWGASSFSSHSSLAGRSIRSSRSSSSSRRSAISSVSDSTYSSIRSHNSKRSGSSMPSLSRNSMRKDYEGQNQEIHAAMDSSIQETKPTDRELTSVGDKILPTEVSPESEDLAQVPRSPKLVQWELDLSNFAFI